MLIHLHNRAIFRHWFKKPLLERHWFKPNGGGEGDDDTEGAGVQCSQIGTFPDS